jgi:hypothetical protein
MSARTLPGGNWSRVGGAAFVPEPSPPPPAPPPPSPPPPFDTPHEFGYSSANYLRLKVGTGGVTVYNERIVDGLWSMYYRQSAGWVLLGLGSRLWAPTCDLAMRISAYCGQIKQTKRPGSPPQTQRSLTRLLLDTQKEIARCNTR